MEGVESLLGQIDSQKNSASAGFFYDVKQHIAYQSAEEYCYYMATWGTGSREKRGMLVRPEGERHASIRHIVRTMDEFEQKEVEVLAMISKSLEGRVPELNYTKPMDQHYVVLVNETGIEVRSRVLSEITLAYDFAKENGLGGTLSGK